MPRRDASGATQLAQFSGHQHFPYHSLLGQWHPLKPRDARQLADLGYAVGIGALNAVRGRLRSSAGDSLSHQRAG